MHDWQQNQVAVIESSSVEVFLLPLLHYFLDFLEGCEFNVAC